MSTLSPSFIIIFSSAVFTSFLDDWVKLQMEFSNSEITGTGSEWSVVHIIACRSLHNHLLHLWDSCHFDTAVGSCAKTHVEKAHSRSHHSVMIFKLALISTVPHFQRLKNWDYCHSWTRIHHKEHVFYIPYVLMCLCTVQWNMHNINVLHLTHSQ